jgi:hypothetical protein
MHIKGKPQARVFYIPASGSALCEQPQMQPPRPFVFSSQTADNVSAKRCPPRADCSAPLSLRLEPCSPRHHVECTLPAATLSARLAQRNFLGAVFRARVLECWTFGNTLGFGVCWREQSRNMTPFISRNTVLHKCPHRRFERGCLDTTTQPG